jgi:hypothetical protein
MTVTGKFFGLGIKAIQSSSTCPNPERARMVFMNSQDDICTQAANIEWVMPEDFKLVSIETVESVERAEPHETSAVLDNTHNSVVGQTLFTGEVFELQVFS